jgi:NADH:ubiquinone oxidoreductase subunit 4 (subunit M)
MNFAMLGLYSVNIIGLQGGFFLMISHSFVSAGLFFLIGSLYKRFNTRNVEYFGGFATFMPVFTIFFFIFMLANFGFPILSSFPAELLIMLGVFSSNKVIFFLLTTGVLLSIVYCMFLFNRVCFGVLNTKNIDTCYDLKFSE